jgi:putative transposon-encoded protein
MDMKKIDNLKSELRKINNILSDLGVSEDVLERQVKSFGNGAHVVLPKHHMDKKVRVIVG